MNDVAQFYRQNEKLRILVRELAQDAQALTLDLGCGRGELSYELAENQRHLVAMDIEFQPCWRQNQPIHFVQANAIQLPFRNNTFDVLVASECLQYIADVQSALNEFFRVLKPSGKLILSFPNGDYYLHFLDPYNIIRVLKKITGNRGLALKVGYYDFIVYPSLKAVLMATRSSWELKKVCRRGSLLFIYYALMIDALDFQRHKTKFPGRTSYMRSFLNRTIHLIFRAMQLDFSLHLGPFSYNCILLLKKPAN